MQNLSEDAGCSQKSAFWSTLTLVVLGIKSTYFSSPFLISLRASSPGTKAARREMEEELATTSLELILNFTSNSPVVPRQTKLSNFRQSARSGNKRECKQKLKNHSKANDVVTNVISANQLFPSTLSMQIFKFQRRSCKLSFLLLERPGELARRLLLQDL